MLYMSAKHFWGKFWAKKLLNKGVLLREVMALQSYKVLNN